ncbi:aldo/keto reductase [Phanerochaete sordida]|uniref:Aldo/keto reductase n=1 Tax=Phanerochaete sordida TaxID=48140 RepID=A0A9P3GBI6_9APHY|nr:aldo/keto reductase [Phanerochaete sordida]
MTVQTTTTLGGTASHIQVGKVAHGLMMMTWTPNPVPDEICFEAIKAGVDAMPAGVKMLLNSGEFYAQDFGTANLELVARFFEKYPEYADRVFLSVKGGGKRTGMPMPDSSPENLRASVENINRVLRGTKKLDLFECARVDHNYPVEETTAVLAGLVKEGLFDHIGMSECSAESLRKGNSVHPIAAVEIEVSPWSIEPETKKVLEAAEELGIAVVAYSPLGRGFLTGEIKKFEDIPEGDMRRRFTRFNNPEIFKHNLTLVDKLKEIAAKKGVTPARLSIAFVASLGERVIPLPGSSNAKRTLENTYSADTKLTKDELDAIWGIINSYEVKGDRYYGADPKVMHLWG